MKADEAEVMLMIAAVTLLLRSLPSLLSDVTFLIPCVVCPVSWTALTSLSDCSVFSPVDCSMV